MQDSDKTTIDHAIERPKTSISAIWILPVIALLFGLWMAADRYQNRPIVITVQFDHAEGITPGKTEVRYEGLTFGKVTDVKVTPSLKGMITTIEVDRKAEPILTDETKFWLVKPEIGITGISGLDTIISGNYIAAKISVDGKRTREFFALESAPDLEDDLPGLHFTIRAEHLGSLHKGSPISYKKINIGRILNYKLDESTRFVNLSALVKPEYAALVNQSSVFWNNSGIRFNAALSGVDVEVDSLASLIAGGIAMDTLDTNALPVPEDHSFRLYRNYADADMSLHATFILPNVEGIEEGKTEIRFRGKTIGRIATTQYDEQNNRFIADADFHPEVANLLVEDSVFWLVKPEISLSGLTGLDTIFAGRYIESRLGNSTTQADTFEVLAQAPPIDYKKPGLFVELHTQIADNLEIGSPILFRKITIGEIENIGYATDQQDIRIDAWIKPEFAHLITEQSKFWNVSGLNIRADLDGINFRLASIMSLIRGGIEFHHIAGSTVQNGDQFHLFSDRSTALKEQRAGRLIKLITHKANSLKIGSPVYFRQVKVGVIEQITISDDTTEVALDAYIEPEFADLLNTSSRFWKVSGVEVTGDVHGIKMRTESMQAFINGGVAFTTISEAEAISNQHSFTLHDTQLDAVKEVFTVQLRLQHSQSLRIDSRIRFHGLDVGRITDLQLADDDRAIMATAEIDNKLRHLVTDGTRFWKVKPKMGLTGFKNLDTVVKGLYLTFKPGEGEPHNQFDVAEYPPGLDYATKGLNLVLTASDKGSIKAGNPLFYRGVQVGQVDGVGLSRNATEVEVYVTVHEPYRTLVRDNSVFWNMSGINVDFGIFSGGKVRSNSIESILAGGIAFATPDQYPAQQVSNEQRFRLHKQSEDEWLQWRPEFALDEK